MLDQFYTHVKKSSGIIKCQKRAILNPLMSMEEWRINVLKQRMECAVNRGDVKARRVMTDLADGLYWCCYEL
ncbi:hypothetical protein [Phaffia rhodozyma]|uniref:Uncharacterized protein n=1 Tax=Phaffia rhodozyma TaxID=264483 RepID=A0A0F7SPI9_PHARH|nr:hypothetical protein [Phaffia rhodozyma]